MWDAEQYLRFETERARPFFDLVAAIEHPHPRIVADLGCGPGGLTATLLARWPDAVIWGIDESDEMTFRSAAVRNLAREQLFVETPEGIEFLSQTLFRARIPVPATVPAGEYHAEVYLFRAGTLLTLQSTPVYVDKTGLERRIYEFAYTASLTYGFVAVLIACTFGMLGFALFRPR